MGGAVWLNGDFVERDDARISAFDASVQHAVGLFETMLAVDGRVFKLHEHIDRLNRSARELNLTESLRTNALAEAVRRVAEHTNLPRARIRLTLTGGDLNMLAATAQGPANPTVLIVAQPATPYPETLFQRGASALIAEPRLNPLDPFEGHKTISYWRRLRELQRAAANGLDEALFLQISNHLACGAVSNLFLVREGTLHTPIARTEEDPDPNALRSPVLPGVTRSVIIDIAHAMGVGCARRMLSIDDLLEADEAFLTNASWGVLPLVRVEAAAIGDGAPGPLTLELREKWAHAVAHQP